MSRHDEHEEPSLPPRLAEELGAIYGSAPRVPPELDRAICRAAGRSRVSWWRSRSVRWGAVAAAALLLLAVRLVPNSWLVTAAPTTPARLSVAPQRAEDVNHDGRVDVLDALALAQHVAASEPMGMQLDFNHDGSVGMADARAVAQAAVGLADGGAR